MQTAMERARQARICVSLWACSYEFFAHSLVSDSKFDEMCKEVAATLHIDTDRPDLDKWFRAEFSPDTGQWIYNHPDLGHYMRKANYLIENKHIWENAKKAVAH